MFTLDDECLDRILEGDLLAGDYAKELVRQAREANVLRVRVAELTEELDAANGALTAALENESAVSSQLASARSANEAAAKLAEAHIAERDANSALDDHENAIPSRGKAWARVTLEEIKE